MKLPTELSYTATHEWVRFTGKNMAYIGITDHAQEALGDLVFVNFPAKGAAVTAGEILCDVESVKAVSDIYSPVTGTVSEFNNTLENSPESINSDPYGSWIAKIEEITDTAGLLTAEEYQQLIEKEG
ncbi:Glycine cleavage system H protein [bioreactor metagenome]|uniref:Glycine cleavage system H protein n=1 Tax=bioreactor metagenome TaxID=1076179 RepID=A0A644ZK17_9ZZZZ|nr:glycine cleavage system protein GcvH [Oscillospiraceae bacterium]